MTHEFDRRSYWIALILAPFATGLACLLISVLGTPFVMLLIGLGVPEIVVSILSLPVVPLWGLIFGLPFYFLLGGPVYWWLFRRGYRNLFLFGAAGLAVNLGSPVLSLLVGLQGEFALFVLLFGSVVAPVWSFVFAMIYTRRSRPEICNTALKEVFA